MPSVNATDETMTPVEQRVEQYRAQLGMMPWSDFEGQRLAAIDAHDGLSAEYKQMAKLLHRQCGKTTRGLLWAIVEAEFSGWELMVVGCGPAGTDAMQICARDLIGKLGLEINVRKTASQTPMIVYVDHLAGYASNMPR